VFTAFSFASASAVGQYSPSTKAGWCISNASFSGLIWIRQRHCFHPEESKPGFTFFFISFYYLSFSPHSRSTGLHGKDRRGKRGKGFDTSASGPMGRQTCYFIGAHWTSRSSMGHPHQHCFAGFDKKAKTLQPDSLSTSINRIFFQRLPGTIKMATCRLWARRRSSDSHKIS
jgi:hypothetical protein